jgi:sucrose-6-phosphate hydrolase SacC (GH32 family)
MIFTGSVAIDEHNTSGFCANGKPCMVAIYTGHAPAQSGKPALETQNIAFSNDRGRTWTKYASNPVLNLNLATSAIPTSSGPLSRSSGSWSSPCPMTIAFASTARRI